MSWLWFAATVIAPALLLLTIIVFTIRYWNRSKELDAYSHRMAREQREEADREADRIG